MTPKKQFALFFSGYLLFAAPFSHAANERLSLAPKVTSGQSLTYFVRYRSQKDVKTESRVVTPMAPDDAQIDAQGILQIQILNVRTEVGRPILRARAAFKMVSADVAAKTAPQQGHDSDETSGQREMKWVEFSIQKDGRAGEVRGLDALYPEQQQAWQQWVRQFAAAAAFPAGGVKLHQKWKVDETETSPSPIAKLEWVKDGAYVRDEPCSPSRVDSEGNISSGDQQPELCAVILTRSRLSQRSSPKDSTPDDYKLHQLKTAGSTQGENETISYISRLSGLVVRAKEEAKQSMDVVIAKTDGSNRVRYNIQASSHTEILLVSVEPSSSSVKP